MTVNRRRTVSASDAPQPVGAYSQAVIHNGLVFTAGQIGLDPSTGEMASGAGAQARRALRSLDAILIEAGSSCGAVLKVTVFLTRMSDFPEINAVFEEFFDMPYPARSAVAVSELPLGALVEIEAVAGLEEESC